MAALINLEEGMHEIYIYVCIHTHIHSVPLVSGDGGAEVPIEVYVCMFVCLCKHEYETPALRTDSDSLPSTLHL